MGDEQRRDPRVARPFLVRYRLVGTQEGWFVSPLRDLSSHGGRFFSECRFEIGTWLELEMQLPAAAQPVALRARVTRVKPAYLGTFELGVAFDTGDPSTQENLDAAVAHFLRKKGPAGA